MGQTLAESVAQRENELRDAAAAEYFQILLRAEPEPGDVEKVGELQAILGRRASDLNDDAELVHQISAGRAARDRRAELTPRLQPLFTAFRAAEAKAKADRDAVYATTEAAIAAAAAPLRALQGELSSLEYQANQCPAHENRWQQVVGGRVYRPVET